VHRAWKGVGMAQVKVIVRSTKEAIIAGYQAGEREVIIDTQVMSDQQKNIFMLSTELFYDKIYLKKIYVDYTMPEGRVTGETVELDNDDIIKHIDSVILKIETQKKENQKELEKHVLEAKSRPIESLLGMNYLRNFKDILKLSGREEELSIYREKLKEEEELSKIERRKKQEEKLILEEKREKGVLDFIENQGTERLKKLKENGFNWEWLYAIEFATKLLPNFTPNYMDDFDTVKERTKPELDELTELEIIKKKHPECGDWRLDFCVKDDEKFSVLACDVYTGLDGKFETIYCGIVLKTI